MPGPQLEFKPPFGDANWTIPIPRVAATHHVIQRGASLIHTGWCQILDMQIFRSRMLSSPVGKSMRLSASQHCTCRAAPQCSCAKFVARQAPATSTVRRGAMRNIPVRISRSVLSTCAVLSLLLVGAMPSNALEAPSKSAILSDQGIAQEFPSGLSEGTEAYEEFVNSPGFHFAPAPRDAGSPKEPLFKSTMPEISPMWTSGSCHYGGRADYPHVTNGEASVHGYWVVDSGSCPSTAKVTATLQAWACSSVYGCGWLNQKSASGTYEPGSGTGRWATPHEPCVTTGKIGWRGRVDVDLSGQVDPLGYDYSAEVDLSCTPSL